jgi:nucleoside-diphosphate-sugar epimerase
VIGLDVAAGADTDITGSVADRSTVDRAFAEHGIEAVIHSGALHKPDIARHPAQHFVDVNVTGTLNLLEAAVAAGHDRFVFTSTTSLMISREIVQEEHDHAVWIDERRGPLTPRNIYGVTKLAAEGLCRLHSLEHGLNCVVLRTARFFPEEDDTIDALPGENLKANEFLNRRLTVEDAAEAHLVALDRAPEIGFDEFIISAPTPFIPADAEAVKRNAPDVISRYFPEAAELYAKRNWRLPTSIGRVYDASKAERLLGFRCATDFGSILEALRTDSPMPFAHDPSYVSPKESSRG